MKRNISFLLIVLFCFILPCFVCAADLESLKANIYLRPEDTHPDGINIEVGTASFWLEVGASVSGDSGETVSYQWYESKTGSMDDIVAIDNETKSIFIPEQKIGTTYYCVGVITTLGDESVTEYTKLLEATFTPKVIDKIWITEVKEPRAGEVADYNASQYTDYELNNYYGYEITSVKWYPDDKVFKEGVEYRVDIQIEFWDNVKLTDKIDVKINEMKADFKKDEASDTAIVSYTFNKLEKNDEKINEISGEKKSGENFISNENLVDEKSEDGKLDLSSVILSTICVVVIIFALIVIVKKK